MQPPASAPPTVPDEPEDVAEAETGTREDEAVDTGVGDTTPDLEKGTGPEEIEPSSQGQGAGMPTEDLGVGVGGPAYAGDADDGQGQGVERSNTTVNISDKKYRMGAMGCLIGLVVSSCIELAQAAQYCHKAVLVGMSMVGGTCTNELGYAVALGAISLIGSLGFLIGYQYQREMAEKYVPYFSLFMVLWWGAGVAVTTFITPFKETGNGFFAVWGSLFISVYLAQISVVKFKQLLGKAMSNALAGNTQKRVLMLIFILSIVEAFACLVLFDSHIASQELWGFLCGLISALFIGIYQVMKILCPNLVASPDRLKYLSWGLVPWWLFGAGVVTFDFPFSMTGNGYFTAWGAFVASVYLAYLTTMGEGTPATPAEGITHEREDV